MKILLTTHLFLPDHSAGTEILVYSTAKELQRLGHEVFVVTGHPGLSGLVDADRFEPGEYDGIAVTRFHHADVPMGSQSDVLEMEYDNHFVGDWFKGILEKMRPDVVHFFHLARLSASLIDVCRASGVPTVFTPTDFWFICPTYQLLLPDKSYCQGPDRFSVNCIRHLDFLDKPDERTVVKKLPDWIVTAIVLTARLGVLPRKRFRFVYAASQRFSFLMKRLNRVNRVILPSRTMERILLKSGLNKRLTRFASFGLNLEHIPQRPGREASASLRLGFIGALHEIKGIQVLLKAMQYLREEDHISLKIYGENKADPDFIAYLNELASGNERIQFCGTFPNSRIGEIFDGIDVLIVPSIWYENTPLIIYSALAAGCPVIASDLGGMAEVVCHMENGILFEPGDAQSLAASIKRLANDRQLLGQLVAGCKRPKSIGVYVAELLAVYRELAGQPDLAHG